MFGSHGSLTDQRYGRSPWAEQVRSERAQDTIQERATCLTPWVWVIAHRVALPASRCGSSLPEPDAPAVLFIYRGLRFEGGIRGGGRVRRDAGRGGSASGSPGSSLATLLAPWKLSRKCFLRYFARPSIRGDGRGYTPPQSSAACARSLVLRPGRPSTFEPLHRLVEPCLVGTVTLFDVRHSPE